MSNHIFLKIIEDIRTECAANITLTSENAKRFFKTTAGIYGAGDEFLGITVPNLRKIVKLYKDIELQVIQELLQ